MTTLSQNREYIKKWISHKKLNLMSQTDLEELLTSHAIDIPFVNYDSNDLKELCYEHKLVNSFVTRGRNKHTGITKLGLLKLCQKFIRQNDLDIVYDTLGKITITIKK